MADFFIKQWKALCLLFISAAWIGLLPVWSSWITENPLDEPISLDPPGQIIKEIETRIPENFDFDLVFSRQGQAFEEVKRLVGDMGVCVPPSRCSKGVAVPISWSLTSLETSRIVSSGNVMTIDSHGWSGADVFRSISKIHVPTGRYLFRADILKSVPELSHIKTRLQISIGGKSASTWQMGLVWWGALGQVLVAWPLGAYALFLLLRAGLTGIAKRQ
ncbi:hypothetical protein HUU62_04640 [Rhodoferax sp. 4810]|nr:hypothetical protein [Rhodoferax jenense]